MWRKKNESDDDGGQDHVGLNPTGRPRRSSAGTRRRKDRQIFAGTEWSNDVDESADRNK